MPNHVTTICTVTGERGDVERFVSSHIKTVPDDGVNKVFDFNTIIPMPAVVSEAEASSAAEDGFFALTGLDKVGFAFSQNPLVRASGGNPIYSVQDYREKLEKERPEALVAGAKAIKAFRETGFMSWYDWSIANWGTKWGAYDFEERETAPGRCVFKFETAWSFPVPVFVKLAEMFPSLVFSVVSYDEGGGFACEGSFNGPGDFRKVEPTPALYRAVYGHDEEAEDEEAEDEEAEELSP